MTAPESHTLDVPGATITYDVRGDLADRGPAAAPLLLIGSPMGAAGFVTLASHFTDRPVVTVDPRGVERSRRTTTGEHSPEAHAEDLAAVVDALGVAPVDVFATSGGAVNALAWVAARPEQVHTLVAHEPPLIEVLPDADAAAAVVEDMYATYQSSGTGPAMAKFIALVMHQGEVTDAYLDRPAPDPAMFGLPAGDDGSRDDPLLGQNLRRCTQYRLDHDALLAAPTRVVVGRGEESGQELAARGADGVAARRGRTTVAFPGGHAGFLGGEYGQHGSPDEFAARLREVLEGA
jgi:pimeloyl-ACP methyl ester carboxylesterase